MAKILTKNSFTPGSAPSGLSAGELAVNVADKKIFVGNAVGGVVTLHDQNAIVTSINGSTGAITNVARTNEGNTFSVRQVMNAGITSSNLYVSGGATFANQLNAQNLKMLAIGGDEGGQIDFELPTTGTSLTGGVAIDIYQNKIRIFETAGTNRGAYIDLSSASAGVASDLLSGGAVSSVSGSGSGISVSPTTGAVVIQNTGVHSINGATGAVTNINAESATITNTNSSSTFYPAFVGGSGATAFYIDVVTTPLSYQPSTGTVNARIFNGTFGSNIAKIDGQIGTIFVSDGTDSVSVDTTSLTKTGPDVFTINGGPGLTFITSVGGAIQFTDSVYAYTFPSANGSNGQVLTTNGAGTLTWDNAVKTNVAQTFTTLQSFSLGISASGGTFTGDIAVNGGDITTSSSTATIFNTNVTTLNIGGTATTINIGGSTGSSTFNHNVIMSDKTLSRVELIDYFERVQIVSVAKGGGLTLDLSSGQVFQVVLSAAVTSITINNIPDNTSTSNAVGFTIIFTADGTARTITWPGSVKWPGGTAPTMTSTNNKKDIISFISDDAGTTWYGFVGGQNF